MICLNCGLTNPASALRCDCGYGFDDGRVKAEFKLEAKREDLVPSWLRRPRSGLWKLMMSLIWVCAILGFSALALVNALPVDVLVATVNAGGIDFAVLLPIVLVAGGVCLIVRLPPKIEVAPRDQ